mgnify:CR=1 FL=1
MPVRRKTRWVWAFAVMGVLLGILILRAAAWAAVENQGPERITSFVSDIAINQDASIIVTETITAVVTGEKIKRGIYRDIPTALAGPFGTRLETALDILSATRNGEPSPHHIERRGGAAGTLRIYFGEQNIFLQPGIHVFQLVYHSQGQLRFFQDHDELYWNVTGNDWEFVIEQASCAVRLPPGAALVQHAAYTGPRGVRGTDFIVDLKDPARLEFSTTHQLPPGHGLTIAAAWPKGFVQEPTAAQKAASRLLANAPSVIGLTGILLLLGYYLYTWNAVGRDPEKGVIIPRFRPPGDLSPAAMRVVMNMGFDDKAFAAAIVNMAVKGFLYISEEKTAVAKKFRLTRTKKSKEEAQLSRGEAALASSLFSRIVSEVELGRSGQSALRKARETLRGLLTLEHEKIHFLKNQKYILVGAAVTLLTLGAMGLFAPDRETALFMAAWLSLWTIGVFFLVSSVVAAIRSGSRGGAIFLSLFALPFILGQVFGLVVYAMAASFAAALAMLVMIGMNGLFYVLMKAPTFEGRRLMDEIEGFKLYLGVAEKDRLDMLHGPEVTPEVFERYLPYAMALDVETRWAERFEQELARTGQKPSRYDPAWYRGPSFSPSAVGAFAGAFAGSFAGALSSSTSSGSGGGGSSGGGGGGGGGGGW